jgi:hypothetical protein
MFDWEKFQTAKGGIKLHRPPEVMNTTEAKVRDSRDFKDNIFPKGSIILEDPAYYDLMLAITKDTHKSYGTLQIPCFDYYQR